MELIEEVISKLKSVGPRPTGSDKEKEFSNWIEDKLKSFGLDVEVQDFKVVPTYSYPYIIIWGLLILSVFFISINRFFSFLLALIIVFLEFRELDTFHNITNLFRTKISRNVIGKNSDKPNLVIMAHIDSARTSIFFHPKYVTSPRISMLLTTGSSLAVLVLAFLNLILPLKLWFYIGLIPSLYLLFLIFAHIHRELFMGFSPGGNDNGSGVITALCSAKILKEENIPFWVVFTGGEESGTYGAEVLEREYGEKLKDAFILNLDNLGAGRLTVATKEGMWRIFTVKDGWLNVIKECIKGIDVDFRPYLGLSTDATVFLARNYNAGTIIALDERGFPVNWHWYTDSVEFLDKKILTNAINIVVNLGRYIK
ncbi:MAG: M28 family peptidase [bacterium]|nr:M28 family peptidase [bacterium]